MTDAMKKTADEKGVKLNITDSKKDVGSELNQVEDLLTRQVDAVIMQPLDGEASQNAAKRVIAANIPLFILSTEFAEGSDVGYKSYIGVDDTVAGEMQAEYLNKALPEGGNIVFAAGIYGAPGPIAARTASTARSTRTSRSWLNSRRREAVTTPNATWKTRFSALAPARSTP